MYVCLQLVSDQFQAIFSGLKETGKDGVYGALLTTYEDDLTLYPVSENEQYHALCHRKIKGKQSTIRIRGLFTHKTSINVLAGSYRFAWIFIVLLYGHYKYFGSQVL